ncbi:MAG: hypothetical protein LC632_08750 [Xanthomonadaceae bacterium]|nr:hypothetical protein [Xanthomonadaceae bacterium]
MQTLGMKFGFAAEWARAIAGAVADCEEMVASERANRLRKVVGFVAEACVWVAWAWLAMFALYLFSTPLGLDQPALAAAELGFRDSLFVVLGLAIVGPIVLLLAWWGLLFGYRVLVDWISRRLPRAFNQLASPLVIFAALTVQWSYRAELHGQFWHAVKEISQVLATASKYTPVV